MIALIVAGFLVLAGGGWFMLIRPQHAKAADLDHQIADTNSAIDAARALTLEAKKGAQIRVADLYRLTKAMPDQVDMAGILLELNQVAEDSGITFELINPSSTATPISGYLAIPITVEFTGQLLRPLGLPLPDPEPRRRAPRHARRDRPPLRDRRGRLRRGASASGLPADPGAPRDRRLRLRHRHRADGRASGRTTGATGATGVTDPDPDPGPRRTRGERVGCSGRDLGMAKKIDPKAKAKRQKIYAGVGGVILLAVLAFQVPRTLKMMHPSTETSSSPAPATTTSATPTPISAPSLAGGNAAASTAAAAPGGDGISDPDAIPAAESGQLLAFGLFRSKDPFVQQLSLNGATGATGVVPASAGATGPTGPATGSARASRSRRRQPVSASTVPTAAATSAAISVNGAPESVKVGGNFPAAKPYFKLVSLTKKGAKISIAGGSLENGAPTVTLTKNKALTLMNTADGTRYVLRLVSVSWPHPPGIASRGRRLSPARAFENDA